MTKVPERPLSYGEVLDTLQKTYKHKVRLNEQKKAFKKRKKQNPKLVRHEYSYENVIEHIRSIGNADF